MKKVVFIPLCCVVVLLSSFSVAHKYYLSLTEIRIDSNKKTLDISSKMFADDLEKALADTGSGKIDLAKKAGDQKVEATVDAYMQKNFKINVGGKLQRLNFVGYEMEGESVWVYLEVEKFNGSGTVSVYDALLYGSFPEQTNLINVSWNDVGKSAKLTNPETLAEFSY